MMARTLQLEEAKALVGFIPSDPQFYPPFLESMDKHIEKKGVEWIIAHKTMLRCGWEHVETLLPFEKQAAKNVTQAKVDLLSFSKVGC